MFFKMGYDKAATPLGIAACLCREAIIENLYRAEEATAQIIGTSTPWTIKRGLANPTV